MLKITYVFPCGKSIEWKQKGDEKMPDDPVECPWHKKRCKAGQQRTPAKTPSVPKPKLKEEKERWKDPVKYITRGSGVREAICEHGVGHPTFASSLIVAARYGHSHDTWRVHGCDGCCKKFLSCAKGTHDAAVAKKFVAHCVRKKMYDAMRAKQHLKKERER